jgi:hypothetical protein
MFLYTVLLIGCIVCIAGALLTAQTHPDTALVYGVVAIAIAQLH